MVKRIITLFLCLGMFVCCLCVLPGAAEARVKWSTEDFIAAIGADAQVIADEHGLYASVMIAQAVNESASGNSGLGAAPNYNLFGIKGSGTAGSVSMGTKEWDGESYVDTSAGFRKYWSWKDSLEDYADLLRGNSGYKGAWKEKASSAKSACQSLSSNYATSPVYGDGLWSTIVRYNLTRFDEPLGYSMDGRRVTGVASASLQHLGQQPDDALSQIWYEAYETDAYYMDEMVETSDTAYRVSDIAVLDDGSHALYIGNDRFWILQNGYGSLVESDSINPLTHLRSSLCLTDDERHGIAVASLKQEVEQEMEEILGGYRAEMESLVNGLYPINTPSV